MEKVIFYFQQVIVNVVFFCGVDGIVVNLSREVVEDLVDKEDLLIYLRDKGRVWQVYYQKDKENSYL